MARCASLSLARFLASCSGVRFETPLLDVVPEPEFEPVAEALRFLLVVGAAFATGLLVLPLTAEEFSALFRCV